MYNEPVETNVIQTFGCISYRYPDDSKAWPEANNTPILMMSYMYFSFSVQFCSADFSVAEAPVS